MTCKIVFSDGAVFDSASIISYKLTESVNSETDICPGAVCSAELEFTLRGNYGAITQGATFTYYLVDDSGAQTKIGVFVAEKPEKTSATTYSVIAYDNVSKTYADASVWLRDHQDDFPMSLSDLAKTACTECGLELAGSDFPNADFLVQQFYADNLQWSQILGWTGQAAARFVHADADGRIEFAWYKKVSSASIQGSSKSIRSVVRLSGDTLRTVSSQVYRIQTQSVGYVADKLSFEDYETAALDKVQIKLTDDDVGTIYPPDETGTNAYVIQGNLLLTPLTAESLKPIAQTIYEALRDVQYTPGSVSLFDRSMRFRAGDIVQVVPIDTDSAITFYVTKAVFSDSGTDLTSTGDPARDSSSAVNQQSYSNQQGKVLELSTSVDGLKITAKDLSGAVSSLKLDVDGIRTEVSGKIDGEDAQTLIDQSISGVSISAQTSGSSSKLVLSANGVQISSASINFTGMVTFSDLSGSGKVVINGDNITTGTIGNEAGNTVYDLDAGTIRTGRSDSNRVNINDRGINWYIENSGTSYLTGVLYSVYGSTYIGCNSRYSYFGWFSGKTPSFGWSTSGKTGSFCGIAIDQVDGLIHCNATKFEIPGRIECSSLSVSGREI